MPMAVVVSVVFLALLLSESLATSSPPQRFSVSARGYFTCVVTSARDVVCVGSNVDPASGLPAYVVAPLGSGWVPGQPPPPRAGPYKAVCAGTAHACGLRDGGDGPGSGSIDCWGSDAKHAVSGRPATQGWLDLACGSSITASVNASGHAAVWGSVRSVPAEIASGAVRFASLSPGDGFVCGIELTGRGAVCYSMDSTAPTPPPSARFVQLSSGAGMSCGVQFDATLACFGASSHVAAASIVRMVAATPGGGGWAQASVSVNTAVMYACALRLNGTVVCWHDGAPSYVGAPPAGALFREISAGWWHSCGVLRPNNNVAMTLADEARGSEGACWGSNGDGQADISAAKTGQGGSCVHNVVGSTCIARVCGAGFAGGDGLDTCAMCPMGTYSLPGFTACEPCTTGPGTAACAPGSGSPASSPCPAGSACVGGGVMYTCATAGYYCPVGSDSTTGHACDAGSFGTSVGAATYTNSTCEGPCTCGEGSWCPAASTSPLSCTACLAGNYCAGGGANIAPCTVATAGHYCPAQVARDAEGADCPPGKWCAGGSATPQPCECLPGTSCISLAPTASSCVQCGACEMTAAATC